MVRYKCHHFIGSTSHNSTRSYFNNFHRIRIVHVFDNVDTTTTDNISRTETGYIFLNLIFEIQQKKRSEVYYCPLPLQSRPILLTSFMSGSLYVPYVTFEHAESIREISVLKSLLNRCNILEIYLYQCMSLKITSTNSNSRVDFEKTKRFRDTPKRPVYYAVRQFFMWLCKNDVHCFSILLNPTLPTFTIFQYH